MLYPPRAPTAPKKTERMIPVQFVITLRITLL
jgi:hypothetical protein